MSTTGKLPEVPVYLAGVLQYIITELIQLGWNAAREKHSERIDITHVRMGIAFDAEMNHLLQQRKLSRGRHQASRP